MWETTGDGLFHWRILWILIIYYGLWTRILTNFFALKHLNDGFVFYKHFWLPKMLIDGPEWCGLLVDYCDVFISCLDSHSGGTHSLQRIHWWASDVTLHFSKSDEKTNSSTISMALKASKLSANFHFWANYSFKHEQMDCTVALCLHLLTFLTAQKCWWGIRFPGQTQNRSTKGHKNILASDFAKRLAKNVSVWGLNIWNVQLCCLPLCNSCIPSWKQHASSAETLQFSILHEGTPSQRHSFPSQLAVCLLIICGGHSVQCNQFLGWLKKEHKVRGVLFGGPFRAAVQLLTWRLEGQ